MNESRIIIITEILRKVQSEHLDNLAKSGCTNEVQEELKKVYNLVLEQELNKLR